MTITNLSNIPCSETWGECIENPDGPEDFGEHECGGFVDGHEEHQCGFCGDIE
jgi:hypothetical protein